MEESGSTNASGYTRNGLPYLRQGNHPRVVVVFDGLDFSHKPPRGKMTALIPSFLKDLSRSYTVYELRRKPGLPKGYTLKDMADDYADFIGAELAPPVDVIGLSTGGTIAQHFAADHPDLVRRLVLGSTGPCLLPAAKRWQLELARLAGEGRWRAASASMADTMAPGLSARFARAFFWLMGKTLLGSPDSADDGVIEVLAEDTHDFEKPPSGNYLPCARHRRNG